MALCPSRSAASSAPSTHSITPSPAAIVHEMGIREGGNMAILAGAGPMGLGAIDYAIHCDRKPGLLVVTDIDQARLDRAASIYTVEDAAKNGVKLVYANTRENAVETLMGLTDGKGYDDVLVFAPVPAVIEQARRGAGVRWLPELLRRPDQPRRCPRELQLLQRPLRGASSGRHVRRQHRRHARGAAHDRRGQAESRGHDHARRRPERRRRNHAEPARRFPAARS